MVQVSCQQVLRYDMGNSEDKNSSILAYNSGLEEDMKFKPAFTIIIFSVCSYLSCAFYMISILVGIC